MDFLRLSPPHVYAGRWSPPGSPREFGGKSPPGAPKVRHEREKLLRDLPEQSRSAISVAVSAAPAVVFQTVPGLNTTWTAGGRWLGGRRSIGGARKSLEERGSRESRRRSAVQERHCLDTAWTGWRQVACELRPGWGPFCVGS
ncbi:hypothetical protein NDU88_000685 [Pleurodeles waltl]|uniref:Uncharacterized protein n=1 Tax=Pleurodeles waltl TaxID=8319 RepID=A0AAV7MQJ5_PLEWA|nr:hypothetical protein NDU88_000685 [Pleurodeles waltl]